MNKKTHTDEQKYALIVAIITSFITTFMGSALNLSIPDIAKEFQTSAQNIGWLITAYMLTCSCLAVTFGRLADIINRRLILRMGLIVFAAASASAVFSRQMWVLLVFRTLQGIGASMIFATNIAILTAAFEESNRGKILGYATCSTYVGLSLGPVLGGVLNYNLGWRSVFIVTAVISGAAFYFAMFKLSGKQGTGPAASQKKSFDHAGNFTFITGIFFTTYGLSSITKLKSGPWLLLTGILMLSIFVKTEMKREQKKADPLIRISFFKENLPYTLSNFAAMLNYGATFAVTYLLSMYLQTIKAMSSQTAGLILITSTLVMAVFSPIFGRISDKKSPFKLSALGMALTAASTAMLLLLKTETPIGQLMLTLAASGFGFALFASPNTNAVMSFVEKEDYGTASALLATMRSAGHTLSMSVITVVLGLYMKESTMENASEEAIMQSLHISFFIFTIFCILGIFMALKRKM